MAAVNLHLGMQELGKRVIEPTIPTKALLELTEHFYKVSGLAAKQDKQADQGKFVFNIHFGGKPLTIEAERTPIDGSAEVVDPVVEAAEESSALLAEVPAYLLARSEQGNLTGLVDEC